LLASPTVLEDVAFALGKFLYDPNSPVKLGTGHSVLGTNRGFNGLRQGRWPGRVGHDRNANLRSSRIQHGLTPVTAPARNTRQALAQ